MRCLTDAWNAHEVELRRFLRHRARSEAEGDDLLQEVFLRAMRRPNGLCGIDNPRAWLFHAARNLVIDRLRLAKNQVRLPDDLAAEVEPAPPALDGLAQCLPRVLSERSVEDWDAITCCAIEGMIQKDYAARLGLTLPGAKSRVQRVRARLKARLTEACRVTFDASGEICCFVPRDPAP